MNIKINNFLLISLAFFLFTCSEKEFEGMPIENLYGEFEILKPFGINNRNPNFSINELIRFHSEFSKPVEYKITIEGISSKATRVINGFSNLIDSNLIEWDGSPSKLPFFTDEFCSIELTFKDQIDTIRDTLKILSPKMYEDGIWLEDFEDGLPDDALLAYNEDGGELTFSTANDSALLGNSYFKMGGKVNWEWNIGKIDFELDLNNVNETADNFFLNIGILSDLEDFHSGQFINILISEETQTPFNDILTNDASDLFELNMEVYKMKVPVDWNGWEIKSFRYSDFEPVSPNNPAIDFNMNPKDISAIRISCQACPTSPGNPICPENFGKIVRTDIDHIMFTANTDIFKIK